MGRQRLATAVVVLLAAAACTVSTKGHASKGASSSVSPSSSRTLTVTGPQQTAAHGTQVAAGPPPSKDLAFISPVYSLTPSGPLPAPVTVTIPLTGPAPPGEVVLVGTRETTARPWTYLPSTLSADRTSVTFTTTHFSLFGVLGYDLGQLVAAFKTDFVNGIDGGATLTVTPPSCQNESAARAGGYHVASSSGDTVFWCLGLDSTGRRVLKVTNHRRYPLEVQHRNLDVIADGYDWAQWSSLSRVVSGKMAIIAPGGTAEFNVALSPGGREGIQTAFDGLGQSLYALQTGIATLVKILTRFGAGGGKVAASADKILTAQSCIGALGKGSGAVIAGCFSPKDIADAFGWKGLLLAPIMAAGPVVAFFHSEWNALVDQFNGHSVYQAVISRDASVPTATVTLRPVDAAG
jgi:hypothetical protein